MDSAKAAVKDFMSKSGHHDTTVHETVAPAVTQETVNTHRHENVTTAIDKEVHQDHYHTSVQPIHDRNVLPEQHHHNLGAVEHRKFEHGDAAEVQARLDREAAKFKDQTVKGDTKHTSSAAPTIAGEHIHHHVHEQIQPVINRQTVEPHVVHTTVPIHEVHHNAAQHHSTSALPAVSMADFKKQGGVLTGREERYDGFEGEPRSMMGGNSSSSTGTGVTGSHHSHGHHGTSTTGTGATGTGSTGKAENLAERELAGRSGTHGSSTTGTQGSGMTGKAENYAEREATGTGSSTTTGTKPSLISKLNPMTDSNGDGQKGFMK